jgi:hypothetical protein
MHNLSFPVATMCLTARTEGFRALSGEPSLKEAVLLLALGSFVLVLLGAGLWFTMHILQHLSAQSERRTRVAGRRAT